MTTMEERLVQLNVRIPRTLKELMKEYVERDTHKDLSEFTRDALREKIQRDAPSLYQGQFESEKLERDKEAERIEKEREKPASKSLTKKHLWELCRERRERRERQYLSFSHTSYGRFGLLFAKGRCN